MIMCFTIRGPVMAAAAFGGVALLALLSTAEVLSQHTDIHEAGLEHPIAPRGEFHPMEVESGPRANFAAEDQVVFADVVRFEGAAWTRLHFAELQLEGESRIRYTSLFDGDVQEMGAGEAAMWQSTSAYFNGDAVLVELIAAPGTAGNALTLEGVEIELAEMHPTDSHCSPPLCGICWSDTREPSDEDWSGRLMPNGCSASVYNETSCIVTAGHCGTSSNSVIQFRVPSSTSGCAVQHPPSIHQYPITGAMNSSPPFTPGTDWGVATTGTSFGLTIYERYGEFRPIAESIPGSGNTIDIYGFGVSETCPVSQTQQHSVGPITSVMTTQIRHRADATCGNSGSGVLLNGEIIGIASHCGQPCPNSSNFATRIDLSALQVAIDALCPIDPPPPPEPPENNACQDRIVVSDGGTSYSTLHATTEGPDEPAQCDFFSNTQIQHDVWYEYEATCSGEMTVSVCNSFFPTKLGVYEGASCPAEPDTISACDALSCPNNTFSEIIMPVEEGESFIIRIGGRVNQTGTGTLEIVCNEVVSECPADLTDTGDVGTEDLFELLGTWGFCPGCDTDLNGDDVVDTEDLFELLSQWGDCP